MPELQGFKMHEAILIGHVIDITLKLGRLPIRVTLNALTVADFEKILTETEYNLIQQTVALLSTEVIYCA